MTVFTRRAILVIAACLMLVSVGVSAWIFGEKHRCEADRLVYRFGHGCVGSPRPVILDRGLRRT